MKLTQDLTTYFPIGLVAFRSPDTKEIRGFARDVWIPELGRRGLVDFLWATSLEDYRNGGSGCPFEPKVDWQQGGF